MKTDYEIKPEIMLIRDMPAAQRTEREKMLLERHFNDLYAVFLHKLTEFALKPEPEEEEVAKLRSLLDALLKARLALVK